MRLQNALHSQCRIQLHPRRPCFIPFLPIDFHPSFSHRFSVSEYPSGVLDTRGKTCETIADGDFCVPVVFAARYRISYNDSALLYSCHANSFLECQIIGHMYINHSYIRNTKLEKIVDIVCCFAK